MKQATIFILLLSLVACARSHQTAEAKKMKVSEQRFSSDANKTYYAVRWALNAMEYPVATENLAAGVVSTTWVATTSDSHYVATFGKKDYGVNGAYYKFDIRLSRDDGGTSVQIAPVVKSVIANLKTSGREEKRLFKKMGDYLRSHEISVTNLGVN